MENHLAGILWMLLTMCLFVSMDTVVKYLTQDFSQFQIVWARFFFHMMCLTILLRQQLLGVFLSGDLKLQLTRSLLLMLTTLLFFSGLRSTELSTATAIMFLSPIFVTVLAVPLLGERVGPRRLIGVMTGFLGALIIVHPQAGAGGVVTDLPASEGRWAWLPEPGHLLVICAAACNALYQIMTRRLRMVDSAMTTLLYSGVVGSIVLSIGVPSVWKSPEPVQWLLLVCVGLLGCVSHFCLIRAFRNAPASLVVPFSYSSLLWATLFGFLVFDALPDRWTLAGASLIIGSGLYIFYRERSVNAGNVADNA
ncbi:MAG: DMT family transporter [Granulosicoccus sp.]|nr:DMT family transporter [Granulosicoccus sp.]